MTVRLKASFWCYLYRCSLLDASLRIFQGDHSSWKVMESSKTIFQDWKVMENSQGHGKSWKMMISRNFFYKNAKFLQNWKFFILVSIHKSCIVYFEKKYVVPIGHGNSFFGRGKVVENHCWKRVVALIFTCCIHSACWCCKRCFMRRFFCEHVFQLCTLEYLCLYFPNFCLCMCDEDFRALWTVETELIVPHCWWWNFTTGISR